jgi:hypothetical protein
MRVHGLRVENFQKLELVDVKFEDGVIKIGGDNEQGKSAVLNAIWVALGGRAVAPAMPIRKGEEECRICLDLGELIVTRKLIDKGDGKPYTDSLKLESADGTQRYTKPQQVLDALMGHIGFDPFAFVNLKPDAQAEMLLDMVPLSIDLEELARKDVADTANRRDTNRDAAALKAQIDAMPVDSDVPAERIDRDAIADQLASAAETNGAIDREAQRRTELIRQAETQAGTAEQDRARAAEIRAEIARLEQAAAAKDADAAEMDRHAGVIRADVAALPALDTPVNTADLREQLAAAEVTNARIDRQARRLELLAQHGELVEKSEAFTKAIDDREDQRNKGLASAKMPIEGLGFAIAENGKTTVMFNGVPFAQASKAEQIKASTAIAMAANPELRVLRISDASLLDSKSMAVIDEMADANDFQIIMELVATENVTVVIENGLVKGAPPPANAKAGADEPAGKLL